MEGGAIFIFLASSRSLTWFIKPACVKLIALLDQNKQILDMNMQDL